MDCHSLQHPLHDEDRSSYSSFSSILKNYKNDPNSLWEGDNRAFAPNTNMYDTVTPYATYTALETYQPEPPPTYTNLTSGGMGGVNMSPLYITAPSLSEESVLAQTYPYHMCKVEESVPYFDEGICSGSSNHSATPPSNENRSSPMQKGSDRGSIADSDFAEGDRLSPGMRTFRVSDESKQQCVKCGISNTANEQWMVESTGHWLCGACFSAQAPAIDQNKRRKSTVAAKRGHISCINCTTNTTSLWRRNTKGEFVCNACGLYEKLHKHQRPLTMKKDGIQRRKRKPKNTDSKKKSVTQTPKSPVRAYQPPVVSSALQQTLMYPSLDTTNHYQSLSHGLLNLPSMNNSNNILFNYVHDPQNQMLHASGISYTEPRILQHLHPSS